MQYSVTFYRAPKTGEKRARRVRRIVRACQNSAEAVAYAAVCLARSKPETVASIVRVTVETTETARLDI